MDLALSEDQELLVDSVSALLDKHSRPVDIRAAEPLGFDPALWAALHDIGTIHMAVPEAQGGWGASMLDLVLVAECLGRHCASAPVVETQVTARLLAQLQGQMLTPLLDDGQITSPALHGPAGGVARLVPAGAVADMVLVSSPDSVLVVPNRPVPPSVPNHANLPLADVATAIDGARLLVREAAWSVDAGHDEAAERQCMAFAFAADVARLSTYWGVHTLGGYGVMLEYDAQLYFRRARGWAGVFGGSDAAYRRVARYRYRDEVPS
ncbi:acyl-CoA dehydrogenase [Mycobacterium stomatepiae]|uniref:Acyl-CoA dehydrogenase n=1 Tax=Mycobacterium stomatepiae TaxID=470076 RepID=A0A7I7Q7B8_9MYCO|nr:acyl-CoA dehydrogenase [Mycobacterium stomatepiae]MCV7163020.1 acyl-CoA dehydrogenase family protein [Mycobacterium stomatepiae]BBY22163.1 hypothetical protein MSTO_23680 [Mycobacterium stomatepiae]